MVKSMTGYGEAVVENAGITVKARIKSLNSRFMEMRLNVPEMLSELEPMISGIVKKSLARGTVTVWVDVSAADRTELYDIEVDGSMVRSYLSALEGVVPMDKTFSMRDVLALPNVLSVNPKAGIADMLSETVKQAISRAVKKLITMRKTEGEALVEDFLSRLNKIETLVDTLEGRKEECRNRYVETLRKRICEIIDDKVEIDEERILHEAAVVSTKSDPTEEITRLKSHISQFGEAIDSDVPIGSKLKFILQECNREVNTIGAKGDDLETSDTVIVIKEELERIREQLANVE